MNGKINFPETIRVGILVYEGFEPIDVWGFTEAFAISRFIGTGYQSPPPYPFEILFISNEVRPSGNKNEAPGPIKSENGPPRSTGHVPRRCAQASFRPAHDPGWKHGALA